jgi:16S rRNA C1402 (ribose-2'-O) methylase RsmI
MTKKFEEFVRGTTTEVYEKLKDKNVKGEIVLVISPQTS